MSLEKVRTRYTQVWARANLAATAFPLDKLSNLGFFLPGLERAEIYNRILFIAKLVSIE
jgi:hypothetical protein